MNYLPIKNQDKILRNVEVIKQKCQPFGSLHTLYNWPARWDNGKFLWAQRKGQRTFRNPSTFKISKATFRLLGAELLYVIACLSVAHWLTLLFCAYTNLGLSIVHKVLFLMIIYDTVIRHRRDTYQFQGHAHVCLLPTTLILLTICPCSVF